jgi:hypothetical protein
MYSPDQWLDFDEVIRDLTNLASAQVEKEFKNKKPSAEELMRRLNDEVESELPFSLNPRLNGVTTD